MIVGDHRDHLESESCVDPANDSILRTTSPTGWWPSLAAAGVGVSLKLGSGPYIDGAVWKSAFIDWFSPAIRIHGHEWEFNHNKPTPFTTSTTWSTQAIEKEQSAPLVIGERVVIEHFPNDPTVVPSTPESLVVQFTTSLPFVGSLTVVAQSLGATPITVVSPLGTSHSMSVTGLTSGQSYEWSVATSLTTSPESPTISPAARPGPRYPLDGSKITFIAP